MSPQLHGRRVLQFHFTKCCKVSLSSNTRPIMKFPYWTTRENGIYDLYLVLYNNRTEMIVFTYVNEISLVSSCSNRILNHNKRSAMQALEKRTDAAIQ